MKEEKHYQNPQGPSGSPDDEDLNMGFIKKYLDHLANKLLQATGTIQDLSGSVGKLQQEVRLLREENESFRRVFEENLVLIQGLYHKDASLERRKLDSTPVDARNLSLEYHNLKTLIAEVSVKIITRLSEQDSISSDGSQRLKALFCSQICRAILSEKVLETDADILLTGISALFPDSSIDTIIQNEVTASKIIPKSKELLASMRSSDPLAYFDFVEADKDFDPSRHDVPQVAPKCSARKNAKIDFTVFPAFAIKGRELFAVKPEVFTIFE